MDTWNDAPSAKVPVFDAFAQVVKAVANGRRLELLELLAQGEHPVEAMARTTGMAMTTTSAHLQTLKRAGLVTIRRDRSTIYYRLAGDDVAALYATAKRVALSHSPVLRESLEVYLGHPGSQGPAIDPAAVTASMLVLDVRPRPEFEAGHFPAAVSMPMDELVARLEEIPSGAQVVVYCRGQLCRMARQAASWLREQGVDAKAMDEGVIEWRASKQVDLDIA